MHLFWGAFNKGYAVLRPRKDRTTQAPTCKYPINSAKLLGSEYACRVSVSFVYPALLSKKPR